MRVLMLSWEFPPLIVGGLARHVAALAGELAGLGHDVRVVTRGEKDEIVDEVIGAVAVRRAAVNPLAIDFTTESLLAWSQAAEHALVRAALPIVSGWRPDVVHAHDWLVAQSSITLAGLTNAPLVATLHSTETGRNQGWLPKPLNLAIHSVERWLAQSADAVITCSRAMRDDTSRLFELDPARIPVVPNGIEAARWQVQRTAASVPTLVFAGRLVHEKGVQTLLTALRSLRQSHPTVRLAIAGTGPHEGELRALARRLGIARAIDWLGFVEDDELAALFASAAAVVVPSLYEPFGIVALEAAAAGAPVVAATTGGLADLVDDRVVTASFESGDPAGLVIALRSVLDDPAATRRSVRHAMRRIRSDYSWSAVAEHTAHIYREVVTHRVNPPRARP